MTIYYQDDAVTLHHGDALEVLDWLEADVLVTDPPYGIAWTRNGISRVSRRDRKNGRYSEHARSSFHDAGIHGDQTTAARDSAIEVWGGDRPAIVFGSLLMPPPEGTKQTAVFVKALDSGNLTSIGGVRRDVEAIYFVGKHRSGGGGRTSVFRTNAPAAGSPHGYVALAGGHPHTKPQDVMQELLMLTSGVIADPFAGSGSTLVAAKQLGRKAIGVELDERYCEMAARRLSQGVLDFGGELA